MATGSTFPCSMSACTASMIPAACGCQESAEEALQDQSAGGELPDGRTAGVDPGARPGHDDGAGEPAAPSAPEAGGRAQVVVGHESRAAADGGNGRAEGVQPEGCR